MTDLLRDALIVNRQADFQIEEKAAHVHIHRAKQGEVVIDGHGFGVQQAAFKQGDFHAGGQQHRIIGARGVAHHQRIDFLGQNQRHLHTAPSGSGERAQQRLVGHKIRRGNHDFLRGHVNRRHNGFINHAFLLRRR